MILPGQQHHLQDERLFECYLSARAGDLIDPPAAEHLADCASCHERYADLVRLMESVRDEGAAEADTVFTPERLRAQQQHILRRVEQVGRPARVISFPGQLRRSITASAGRTAPRGIAAAAAAGIFVGVALGASYQLNPLMHSARQQMVKSDPARLAPVATRGSSPADVAEDDAFLSDLDVALERPHTRELLAFDAFTPHVREVHDRR